MFTITGHGWGHGIGMSQYGAYGYAKHGWHYKAILKHYYTGIAFGTVGNDPIRVRLRSGVGSVKLTCAKAYHAARTGVRFDIGAGVTATVTWVNGRYRVVAGGKAKSFTAPVTFTPDSGSLNLLTATDLGDTGRFRGVIRVLRPDGGFMIVNKLPLESYLRGVVPHEVSPSWPAESLKAQAVRGARLRAALAQPQRLLRRVLRRPRPGLHGRRHRGSAHQRRHPRHGAVSCPPTTASLIVAFYFSSSGGHTENIENSWQTSAVPYLKGVSDPYDTYSPRHDLGTGAVRRQQPGQEAGCGGERLPARRLRRGPGRVAADREGRHRRLQRRAVHARQHRAHEARPETAWAYFRSMSISPAAATEHHHGRPRHRRSRGASTRPRRRARR